jgi:hypothetical protein
MNKKQVITLSEELSAAMDSMANVLAKIEIAAEKKEIYSPDLESHIKEIIDVRTNLAKYRLTEPKEDQSFEGEMEILVGETWHTDKVGAYLQKLETK